MEDFTLYAVRDGVEWYRCKHCAYLSRGKVSICPVCKGNGKLADTVEKNNVSTDSIFEHALQQLKDIMQKYGG